MEWFLLALNVALSGSSAIALKFYQKKNGMGATSAYLFTAILTGTIALVSICVAKFSLTWNATAFWLSAIMGLLYAINIPLYGKAMGLGSIGLCGVFLNLGSLLLPFIYGVAFLGEGSEANAIFKWIGLVIALCAVLLQIPVSSNSQVKKQKSKTVLFFFLGMGTLLVNGLFCVFLKVQAGISTPAPNAQVMFFAGLFGSAFSFAALGLHKLIRAIKGNAASAVSGEELSLEGVGEGENSLNADPTPDPKTLLFAALYGALNGTMNILNLVIAAKIPAAVQFAVLSCGGLLLMALFGIVLFKDKFTKKTGLTLLFASLSILFFAL